jgi:ornithine cyclodeaminase
MRTAATSVMAAKALARKDSRCMALIGNGAQSEFQALAFHHLLGIDEVRVFDIDAAATMKLVANLSYAAPKLRVVPCPDTAEAVRGADIVTTVTADKTNAIILTPPMLEPGMHINAIGGDCPGKTELHGDILRRPDARVVVEFEPQSRIEGEIQQLEPSFPVMEFADVLTGKAQPRLADSDVTIFDSVGFALEDFSALRYLHRLHQEERGTKREIDLLPRLADPKDLFGELAGRLAARASLKVAR